MALARLTYFSGTGNTRWVAERLGLALRDAGYDVTTAEVAPLPAPAAFRSPGHADREGGTKSAHDMELEVFLFPVFAFALPHLYRQALRRLPRAPLKPAAVVAVYGDIYVGRRGHRRPWPGYEGGALVEARRLLERRGYVVFASHALGLPASLTQFLRAPSPEEQAEIVGRAQERITSMARSIARKEGGHPPFSPAHWLWNWPVRTLFRLVGRRLCGKLFVADSACTGCGLCARQCPASTIHMHGGRPRWGWRCEGCQRCINACPESAIQTSPARTFLAIAATVLPYNRVFHLEGIWGRVGFLGEWGARAFWVGSWLLCASLALGLVDTVLFAAERPLRRILAWGVTRRFPRYRGPRSPAGRSPTSAGDPRSPSSPGRGEKGGDPKSPSKPSAPAPGQE